ncbi:hypothetical protein CHMI_00546 [Cellulomonas hominis]|nr:hypothetical protein CHMI_00546 [Cellulomonas hominis]
MMSRMGLINDYFAAPSDESAAEVVDHDGGPASPTVPGGRIDSIVVLGTVTALLTGRTFDEVLAAGDRRDPVAMQHDGTELVLRVDDVVVDALTGADDDALAAAAVPWSRTEELAGVSDPEELADFLRELAGLARDARARGGALYCWVCV